MRTLELRSHLHQLIDGIQNEQFLQNLYDFLSVKKTGKGNGVWQTLTDEQKNEVLLAWDESEDEKNLIDPEQVFGKNK